MKNLMNFKTLLAVTFLAIIGLSSCSKSDDPVVTPAPPVDNTITGKAIATPDLSILVAALTKADLAATLQTAGPFTVFAPTNAAFTAAGISVASINAYTPAEVATLKQILLNHVVSGATTSAQLTDNTYIKTLAKGFASTTNTLSMYVAKTAAGAVKLNGTSNVTTANIAATNGVIHLVDSLIMLPTIVTHAVANPAFKLLVKAVTSTATNGNGFGDQTAVANALTTNTTALTVFAPIDAAFITATSAGGFAAGATAAQVTKVLQYHVTGAGNVLAASLTQGQIIPTVTAPVQNLTVDLVGGAKLSDTTTIKAKIIVTDVQCANGIIHAVDKVLQPTL